MNFKVAANSNSTLTKVWAFHKSQQNFDKLPLPTQKDILQTNRSWLGYFNVICKLGLITESQRNAYRSYVLNNKLQGRSLNFEALRNIK
jgi:hypothetical protein